MDKTASEHEDNDAKMGRVTSLPFPDVYLEAMEEPTNKDKESYEVGSSPMASL